MISIRLLSYCEKGLYPQEYMDNLEKLSKTPLPEKANQTFYSHLNMEDITDVDYTLAKKVCKGLKNIKRLDEYDDFYVQSDKWLFGDVFSNF